jgi:hypothetical protein
MPASLLALHSMGIASSAREARGFLAMTDLRPPSRRALYVRHAEPTNFLNITALPRVGIPNCETTQGKTCPRAEPVSFKYWLLYPHFIVWGLLRQHARRVASSQ